MKRLLIAGFGILIGIVIGYLLILFPFNLFTKPTPSSAVPSHQISDKQVIGFFPYWLLGKADDDYSGVVTQLSYFALTIDSDGHIKKLTSPIEEEPGWYTLHSGKMDEIFTHARKKNINLSLTVFSGENDTIDELMSDPITHAKNLVSDIIPLMKTYHFTDLNLDIEKVTEASASSQEAFYQFTNELKIGLDQNHTSTLTVDISASDVINQRLIHPQRISSIADYLVIMAYDYHFAGSFVTGPVAPLLGAGIDAEYDANAAVGEALKTIPSQKIILGIPSYGYEWETIKNAPRSAVIPGTGQTASSRRVGELLKNCTNCDTRIDAEAVESYVIYLDENTSTYHQLFYPTKDSTSAKTAFVKQKNLGGIAIWALGYEGEDVLTPLKTYLSE